MTLIIGRRCINILYLNSMYTQDAGVPQLPMEFFEDLTYYFDIDKHNSFFDINIMVYNNLKVIGHIIL